MGAGVRLTGRYAWEGLLQHYPVGSVLDRRRRDSRRHTASGKVQLVYRNGQETVTRVGKLMNVSAGGLLLKVPERVRTGRLVVLRLTVADNRVVLAGRVEHCTETADGFKVGVQLMFNDLQA